MLKPEYIAGIADSMIDIYAEVEDEIIADIARRIVRTGVITDTAAWQIEKARQVGYLRNDVTNILAKIAGRSEKEIAQLLKDAAILGLTVDDKIYRLAGLTPSGLSDSPVLSTLLMQGFDSTKKLLNNWTQTRALEAERAFRTLTDKAYLQTISGAMDSTTAIRNAVNELARSGITDIAYPSGVHQGMDYAVRRAVITGVNQSVAKLQLARAQEMGCELVEVTSHAGARPSHAVWQGQVYCIAGHHRKYKDFYAATGYGNGDGLCGWNCYHSFYPFFEGLSARAFSRDPSADMGHSNDEDYALSQKQRYYERQIRKAKSECTTISAAMDAAPTEAENLALKDSFTAASVKLKRREARMNEFIHQTGRTRLRERESPALWGVSQAAKSRGAAQASHTQWLKSINAADTELKTLAKYYEGKYNNSREYQLLSGYSRAVEKGDISPLVGFDLYRQTAKDIERMIVGQTASNGVKIESYATHFIDRIIGQVSTPHGGMRQGVSVEDALDALLHPVDTKPVVEHADGDRRQTFIGENASVVISIRDHRLIQTNPR